MSKCPCNGCVAPDRHLGCHSNCDKGYKEWAAEKRAGSYKSFLEKDVDDYARQSRTRFRRYEKYKQTKNGGR